MTRLLTRIQNPAHEREAIVWIDSDWAIIVGRASDGRDRVAILDRMPSETEAVFDNRAIDQVIDQDRVVVSGPDHARTGFERAYVALTHRPDRLLDVEPWTQRSPYLRRTA